METRKAVIRIEGLCKSFGDNVVLDHFDLTLYEGENLVVLGKSGSGKSVLIKCIIGLLHPDAGRIEVFGENVPDLNYTELDQMRARVGFLFQSNALYDSMTVRENLEFPLRRHWMKTPQKEVDERVHEVLKNVGLAHTTEMMPAELSGGMRKRIALARTLILHPSIILYDEPTTGLDPITGMEIIELIQQVQQEYHTASLVISHDLKLAQIAAERVIMLIDGKCYAQGTFNELRASTDPKVKAFFD
ncbi:MAG: ATP-binding cassette domain-containing protein [Lewinellaceae bacterium]|nr:ATP-binding cassette domain-containing protein [Saprospiraceae bacterium]MCB9316310.1 ATP-binding cassette domain-containing protein [Lewinellaceae bacterium]MCB9334065.1 ATP-binding cassette domain-containing protein [Lewinellaceae bacterium]